ncbi:SWIM zinc finger domain-containing protein, partial [Paenibacillus sp. TAF58]
MSSPIINDEKWLELLEYVAEAYNEVTLSRGFTYFKKQRVTSLIVSETLYVQARVAEEESGEYRVILNLDKPRSSQCSCPVPSACKHMAAVWMELGDRLGYPAIQIMNAKLHLKRATSSTSLESTLIQLPKMDVFGWQKFLNQFTSLIKETYDLGNYVDMLRLHLQSIKKTTIPFSDMDQIFFDMHQELFILRKLKEQNAQGGVSYYTSSTLYRVYDEIHIWLKQKSPLLDFSVSGERLEQTLSYIRQQMAEESGHSYQDYGVYTVLWKHWVAPDPEANQYVTKEIEALEAMILESPSPSLAAAKAFLYLQ